MTSAPASSPTKTGVLINRNFALLFFGQTLSVVGDFVFNTTLILWIAVLLAKGQTWAPLAVSGVLLAASVPVLLIGPLAGVFVDRWDKRGTLLRVSIFQALAVTVLLALSGVVPLPFAVGGRLPLFWMLGAIYAVVFLINAGTQFVGPASLALVGDIVREPDRPRASGLTQVIFALATIVGPPIAAPLLFAFGVQWALVIDAASFLVLFVFASAIRAPKAATSVAAGDQGHFWRELGQGIAYFFRSRVLVGLLLGGVTAFLGAGALNALDVFFVTKNLHTPALDYGFIGGTQAVGVLLGAILFGAFAQRIGLVRLLWLSLFLNGIDLLVWARLSSLPPALVVIFLSGLLQAGLNVAISPILLNTTPRALVGRVLAVLRPLLTLASLVSIALAGYLDSTVLVGFHAEYFGIHFGPLDTIFLVAGAIIVLGGLLLRLLLGGISISGTQNSSDVPEDIVTQAPSAAG
jgi:MFS family permease